MQYEFVPSKTSTPMIFYEIVCMLRKILLTVIIGVVGIIKSLNVTLILHFLTTVISNLFQLNIFNIAPNTCACYICLR